MATRISYGVFPQLSFADIPGLLIDGLSAIWMELALSVFATIVYGVCTESITWVPLAKAKPNPEEAQCDTPCMKLQSNDSSPKVTGEPSAPKRGFRSALVVFALAAGIMGVGFFLTPQISPIQQSSSPQKPNPTKSEPTGREDDAVAILRKQLTQSTDPAARHKVSAALAATLRSQGDLNGAAVQFAQAVEAAREAKNEWGEYETILALASLQRRLGRFPEAAASATAAVEIAKNGLPPATDLASIMKRRDSQTATAAAWAELAQIRSYEGHMIEANGRFKLVGSTNVEVAQAAYHVLKGDTQVAIQSLVKTLERKSKGPDRGEALLWLSRAQKDSGKSKEALETARAAFSEAGPSAPDTAASALVEVAGLLTTMAAYDEAEATIQTAEDLVGSKELDLLLADVKLARATVLLHRGEAKLSEALVRTALSSKSAAQGEHSLATTQAMVLLGQTLLAQGRPEEAKKIFEDAKKNMIHFHGFFHGINGRIKWFIAAAYQLIGKDQWAVIQRRIAIDDVIAPLRGQDELAPGAAADRMLAALQMRRGQTLSVEERDLCVALRDIGPGDTASGALKRRSAVLNAWGRCPGKSESLLQKQQQQIEFQRKLEAYSARIVAKP